MRKVIIDTDPGIDDAMAILFAMADPGIELLGLTTIFGNVHTAQATRNALRLVELMGHHVPVAHGAEAPLRMPQHPPADFVHGPEGFGDIPAEDPAGTPDPRGAARFLAETCAADPGEVTICAVGPLTNLAHALRDHPEIVETVREVVVMGGSIEAGGNVTPHAEANIWNDPHAAAEVFAARWPMRLVGLDVTQIVRCTRADFAALAEAAPVAGGFLNRAADFYFRFHVAQRGFDGCYMHDPTAVIAVTDPGLFDWRETALSVPLEGGEIARTVPGGDGPPVACAMGVDAHAVRGRFLATMRGADTAPRTAGPAG